MTRGGLVRFAAGTAALAAVLAPASADARGKPPPPPSGLAFAGYTWDVKSGPARMGPGPNYFATTGASVDSSAVMHLRIAKSAGKWTCGEVILDHTLGYGTYEWTVRGPIDSLDRNVVLGLFTWDDANTSPTHREIDIEDARWGNAADPTNAQYVVQPYDRTGNLTRLTVPPATSVTVRFTWRPGRVDFSGSSTDAAGNVTSLPSSANTSSDVPTTDTERVHMNLWLYQGLAPSNGQPVDVAITGFRFTPV